MRESAIRIDALSGRRVWQLKTWLPAQSEIRVGETSPAFGGVALGIGPQECLVVSDGQDLQLGTQPSARDWIAIDLSDAFSVLEVQGESARQLLSKGCGLDLHPRVFGVGRCARTRFAQIPVVLTCSGEPYRFELYAARSYAQYLRAWLADAAADLTPAPRSRASI